MSITLVKASSTKPLVHFIVFIMGKGFHVHVLLQKSCYGKLCIDILWRDELRMADLGLTDDELTTLIFQVRATTCAFLAGIVWVSYDILLNLSREINCVWRRKLSGPTLLYLIIRYGTLVNLVLEVFQSGAMSVQSKFLGPGVYDALLHKGSICKGVGITTSSTAVILFFAFAAFNCLRIWATCREKWAPFLVVFVLSVFVPALSIYQYSQLRTFFIVQAGPLAGCFNENDSTQPFLYWSAIARTVSVTSDIAILACTWWQTARTSKSRPGFISSHAPLTTVLFRSGCLQFAVLLLFHVVFLALDILAVQVPGPAQGWAASAFVYTNEGQLVITSMLLCHFILNLRSLYVTADPDTGITPTQTVISTVRFADESFVGNMGAPLNTPWETEDDDAQTTVFVRDDDSSMYTDGQHTPTYYVESNEARDATLKGSDHIV